MDVRNLIHTPADAAQERVQYAEQAKEWPGVTWGIPALDRRTIPMHPGDMVVLCGRPGHCKSSVLAYLARTDAERIRREQKDHECVVYVTWEQVTEEVDSLFHLDGTSYTATDIVRGNVDMDTVRASAVRRVGVPVWLIGQSAIRDSPVPTMDIDAVARAVRIIRDEWNKKVTLLCADYLQLIPVGRGMDMTAEVTYAAGLLKWLAKECRCPAVVAVQARREVDDRQVKIPDLRDAQWASRIEQACDKWYSLWRPWVTNADQKTVKVAGENHDITENLLVIRKLKERFNSPRFTMAMHFDPKYVRLTELESEVMEPPSISKF